MARDDPGPDDQDRPPASGLHRVHRARLRRPVGPLISIDPTARRSSSASPVRTRGRGWLRLAAGAGLLHAAASLYWTLGGRWLLDTVGAWAVALAVSAPVAAGLALGGIAVVKALGAVVPLPVEEGRWPGPRRWWRALEWAGGIGLLLYGGVNAIVAALVLTGVIEPDGGYDPAAMWGHAALWDPLFAVWGLALLIGLWRSRRPGRA